MSYLNVGALDAVSGDRIKTKAALKRAMKDEPASVTFDPTDAFWHGTPFRGNELPYGMKLSVVGPDPFTARKWYATVQVVNGTVKVS